MDFNLENHFHPKKGWMNDPNGLVYFKGNYHIFYQSDPDAETPTNPISWGHAITKDFKTFEHLPPAITPDSAYDAGGCFSGTAIVKDDVLYIFYASIINNKEENYLEQRISMAYSYDGINFTKCDKNPIIPNLPKDASRDFRDPAVTEINGIYYMLVASGNEQLNEGRLLLYKSADLILWDYVGICFSKKGVFTAECPSFMKCGDKYLITVSFLGKDDKDKLTFNFSAIYGDFDGKTFIPVCESHIQCGPDQYAGQGFCDDRGRNIFIAWIPGWKFTGYAEKSLGCLSAPMEFKVKENKITAYPTEECRHLLKPYDDAVTITDNGFLIKRKNLDDIVYDGGFESIEFIRDKYVLEIFINHGEKVFTAVLD